MAKNRPIKRQKTGDFGTGRPVLQRLGPKTMGFFEKIAKKK